MLGLAVLRIANMNLHHQTFPATVSGANSRFITVRNSSCGKVMFSQVCQEFCPQVGGGAMCGGGVHGRGLCMGQGHVWRGHALWGTCVAGETATAAEGTHPTGMHSCHTNIEINGDNG